MLCGGHTCPGRSALLKAVRSPGVYVLCVERVFRQSHCRDAQFAFSGRPLPFRDHSYDARAHSIHIRIYISSHTLTTAHIFTFTCAGNSQHSFCIHIPNTDTHISRAPLIKSANTLYYKQWVLIIYIEYCIEILPILITHKLL